MTEEQQAQGEQDAAIAVAEEDHWQIDGGGMLTVRPVEEWVPRAHRRATNKIPCTVTTHDRGRQRPRLPRP